MLDNFEWPKPDGAPDEVLFRNVRERGCHLMSIAADAEGAGYVFSTGLYLNYGHAELILFGLDPNDACVIINEVRDRAAAGRRYVAGDVCTDLPLDRKVCFVEVPLDAYQEYLGTAIWFYAKLRRPFPCLQIAWSDPDGRFPWRRGATPSSRSISRFCGRSLNPTYLLAKLIGRALARPITIGTPFGEELPHNTRLLSFTFSASR